MTAPTDRDHVLGRYAKHVNKSLASLARLVGAPVEVAVAGSRVRGSDGQNTSTAGASGSSCSATATRPSSPPSVSNWNVTP